MKQNQRQSSEFCSEMSIWSLVIQICCQLYDILIFKENSRGNTPKTFYLQEINYATQVLSKQKNLEIKALPLLLGI